MKKKSDTTSGWKVSHKGICIKCGAVINIIDGLCLKCSIVDFVSKKNKRKKK